MLRSLLGCCMSKNAEQEVLSSLEEQKQKRKVEARTSPKTSGVCVAGNVPRSSNSSSGVSNFALKKGNTKKMEVRKEVEEKKSGGTGSEEKKSVKTKSFKIIEPQTDIKHEQEIIEQTAKKREEAGVGGECLPPAAEVNPAIKLDANEALNSIDPKIISTSRKVRLEVLEGPVLKPQTTIEINAGGLVGSKRMIQDGCAYFGTEAGHSDYPINDFIVPQEEKGFGKRHFVIKYDVERRSYFLKDLEDGTGTFIKIAPKYTLVNNCVISFGEIHFATILPPVPPPQSITVKFLEGPKAKQVLTFKAADKSITIGRKEGSTIHFPSGSLSRCQCKIVFEEPNWVIYDGDGSRPSTNGTWLFADDFYEVYDQMIFKAAQTLFKINLVD